MADPTPAGGVLGRCEECGRDVPTVTPAEAAASMGCSEDRVHELLESGVLHGAETPAGLVRICAGSLKGLDRASGAGA